MNAARERESAKDERPMPIGGDRTAELAAVTTILVLLVCVAASVVLIAPRMLEAAANSRVALQDAACSDVSERPFHERHQMMSAAEDSIIHRPSNRAGQSSW